MKTNEQEAVQGGAGPEWTTPDLPPTREPDELDEALHGLAVALKALRRAAGPTRGIGELESLVRSLLGEAQDLTPERRRQACRYLRDGLSMPDALLMPGLMADDVTS